MLHLRTRDLGAFNTNIELMIRIVIVSALLAIAVPVWLSYSAKRGRHCLENIASLAAGTLPADAKCPVSGKPYATTGPAACPEPAGHLDGTPKLHRTGSSWRLEQTLPTWTGSPPALGNGAVEAAETPTELRLTLHARTGLRRVLAVGIMSLLGLGIILLLGLGIAVFRRKESPVPALLTAAVFAALLGFTGWWWGGERTYLIPKGAGRVVRQDLVFGRVRSEAVIEGILGVVPIPAPSWGQRHLVWLHAPPGKPPAIEDFEPLPAGRLDMADRIQRALVR